MKLMFTKIALAISLLIIVSACGGESTTGGKQYVNIGTAGTGGAYYPIGIAMAEVLSQELDLNSSAEVTGGAADNVELVQAGEVELAISQSPVVYAGYNGNDPYEVEHKNISTLFNGLSKGVFHVVVSENSNISSMSDLKGKRVVLGPAGGGAINVVADILSVYDVSIDDLNATYVSYSEGVSMLNDNTADAVIIQSAAPASAITELAASSNNFRILAIEEDKLNSILSQFTYLNHIELPSEMYGTESGISTVYLTNMVIVSNSLDEEIVYNITKNLFDNLDKVKDSHPSAQGLTLESAADNVPIPLHPGAERYFKEKGILD
ncbi:TAXI family TRAP transporter solute-binding subunit [Anaerobacillus sp. MEB173]|uniref:TAXI family TRAP transporter solute-binding subunit n=1 Tax=Anaerobacillus sp. MEB173 TaxID=3383345 RepID=UPI003F93476E